MSKKLNTCNFTNIFPAPQILFLALFSLHYQYLGGFGGAFKLIERRKYYMVVELQPLHTGPALIIKSGFQQMPDRVGGLVRAFNCIGGEAPEVI